MNSTRFKSLTEFASYLGKEGICRVEATEKGLFISWIDNSPETMRKREAIMKKERQDKGDEEREQRMIQEQVERAQANAKQQEEENLEEKMLQREEGEKVTLNFGFSSKPKAEAKSASPPQSAEAPDAKDTKASADADAATSGTEPSAPAAPGKISMSLGAQKPKNVFASAAKKNPLAGKKGPVMAPQKKMTEQERIMKAEMEAMERKRSRPDSGFGGSKRPRISLK
jgi:DNA/RNA-binding protein KIN17